MNNNDLLNQQFKADLVAMINAHSMENGSNTPDWILGEYLVAIIEAFNRTIVLREEWYGRDKGRSKNPNVAQAADYAAMRESQEHQEKTAALTKEYLTRQQAFHDGLEQGISEVLRIRCIKHRAVPQLNTNEYNGGECGACIVETFVESVKAELQHLSKGEVETWGFVSMFFNVLDKAASDTLSVNQHKQKSKPMMRAKMMVHAVVVSKSDEGAVYSEQVNMAPVCRKPFDKDGNSEDNTYAKWTPTGRLDLTITNPSLFGKIQVGKHFYVDFTEAVE